MKTGVFIELCVRTIAVTLAGSAVCAYSQTSGPIAAQSEDSSALQEIVVTAEKQVSSVQTTPVSVSVVSGAFIAEQGVKTLDDALKDIAGVKVSQSPGPAGFDPTIRGVGPAVPTTFGADTGVATNYDGVYNSSSLASVTGYYDVSRIEVLKGPQGTLYGRNAEGGVVNILTNNPTGQYEGAASFEYGNYDLVHINAMLNAPLSDVFAVRIAGSSINRKGYLSNGQDDDVADSVRAKAMYTPSNVASVLLGVEYTKVGGESSGVVNSFVRQPPGNEALYSPFPDGQIFKQDGYKIWSEADVDFGFAALTVLPAYQWQGQPQQLEYNELQTVDSLGLPGGLKQKSFEARLSSEQYTTIKWIAGAYYYDSDQAANALSTQAVDGEITPVEPDIYRRFTAKSKALFAQTSLPIVERLRAVLGVRESWDTKTAFSNQAGASATTVEGNWKNFDFKTGLEYDLTPASMLYTTYSTGNRPGGISPAPPNPVYADEHLRSLEIGSKNEFFNQTWRVNAAFYHYNYSNLQEPNLVPTSAGFELSIPNVPRVVNYGAELESEYLVTPEDTVSLATAYMHSEVKSNIEIFFTQMQGLPLPNSPPWTVNAGYKHVFDLGAIGSVTPKLDIDYSSPYYVTIPPSPVSTQYVYWQEDLSLSYAPKAGRWTVNAYGKNLSNKILKTNNVAGSMVIGPPRTVGIVINAHF